MSHTKTQPVPQVMSQLEPELAAWLLEDIPNNHWVHVCYQLPDVIGAADDVSAVPLADVSYRIVSLQDENITVSGKLDSLGQAYHEGFVPGPVAVYLATEDTVAVEMEADNLRQNLQQSFDSLSVLLSSQKMPLDNNLQQKGFVPYQCSPAIVDAAVDKKPTEVIQLLSIEVSAQGQLADAHKISIFLLLSDDTFTSTLRQFIEKLWQETDGCVCVRGFVLDLLNGLLIEALLGEGMFFVNGTLSLLDCCKQHFPPAALLLDEIVLQLQGIIPLFQQSKISTTLQGRTNTEIVVQWREPPNPQRCDRHYSNVALMPTNENGEVLLAHTDFELNGPVPLRWTRHYSSSYTGGWSCVANEAIHVSKGWVNYCREDGVIVSFELPPIGKYSTNITCGLILQRVFYSVFVVKGEGGVRRIFSGLYSTTLPPGETLAGRGKGTYVAESAIEEIIPLTQLENHHSEHWQFYYKRLDCDRHQLVRVKSSWGHEFAIEWNSSGYITRVVNKNDGKVLAQYDWGSNGLLRASTDIKRHWQYTYMPEDPRLISTMTDLGGTHIHWGYDAQGRVLISASGKNALQRIELSHSRLRSRSKFRSEYGSKYSYDKNHLLTVYTDVDENVSQYRYNVEGMLSAFIDPAGGGFSLSYDDQGQVQEVTNALGESWGCEYNKQGVVEAIVDPEGVAYRINCVAGRPVSMSVDIDVEANPLSVQRYWQWDTCANLIMDSANGPLNQATYDTYGKLTQLADRGQEVLSFDYNPHNQLRTVSANGAVQLALMYHGSGMVSQIAKASGQNIDLQFDDCGRLLGWTESVVSEKYTHSLSIQYDAEGRVSRLDCHGKNTESLQFQYEIGPLPSTCIDASGGEFQLAFSEKGLLLKCEERKLTWQYDACGRQVYRSNTKQEVKTQYDVLGRVVEHAEGKDVVQCVYQSRGQLAQYLSPLGKIEHTYNLLGFRVSTTHSKGYAVVYQYGAPGMLERIEINGNVVLEYIRDTAGVELYRKQGAYRCEGDTSAAHWVDTCFDSKTEEVIEELRLWPGNKHQLGVIEHLMIVLQLEVLNLPPLLQRKVRGLQDNNNPMRGVSKISESSQIENGIVVHHPVNGEPLLIIYQNQVYFYESNREPKWRDWNGNDVALNGIHVAREYLPINPLGDVDIKGVMKEPPSGMLWDFVTKGVATTVLNAVSLTYKSNAL
ncbi:hypothetical protein A9Q81_14120 [Gammaproteobacteria bacterium 42_54_T18]|nr:hypothetical protein A9Q81_14120 [Gammaproteobacteria bacterium 42_54_T18]